MTTFVSMHSAALFTANCLILYICALLHFM